MTTIDTSGRPGYMYDEATTTWYAISGRVSTSANYVWTGAQQFDNNLVINGGITATLKLNVFLNPAARASAITAPATGLITFIQQDGSGNTINRIEYWNGSAWTPYADPATITTITGTQTLTNKTLTSPTINGGTVVTASVTSPTFTSPQEVTTISATAATGTINYDCKTQGILYYTTNASGNFTLNFRGNGSTTLASMLSTGQSITVSFLNTNGSPAYYPSAFQVDGTATGVAVKWSGGTAPSSGNASAVDAYSFTIVKTGTSTYTIFAGAVKFA